MTCLRRVLIVGVGGLGSPVARILAQRGPLAGPLSLTLLDDDVVDATNLHRQPLFRAEDVGAPKVERAALRLAELAKASGTALEVTPQRERLQPENALGLVEKHDLVIEGTDNLASKFLAADAAALSSRPIVHAGVVRWSGWVKGVWPGTSACLRCIFEDVPADRVETCAEAGVVGPLVGLMGALQAAIALRMCAGDQRAADTVTRVDARRGQVRTSVVRPRAGCALCGPDRNIRDLAIARYVAACGP